MGCAGNPAVATLMGVAIGLACFMAAIGAVFLMVEVSRWLVWRGATPAMHPAGTRTDVRRGHSASDAPVNPRPVGTPTRCSCGATAKSGKTQCGPCARGERICAPIGGEPVGGA